SRDAQHGMERIDEPQIYAAKRGEVDLRSYSRKSAFIRGLFAVKLPSLTGRAADTNTTPETRHFHPRRESEIRLLRAQSSQATQPQHSLHRLRVRAGPDL